MQLHLDDVALFVRVAELGSLSGAARERNVPASQVSRAISRIEAVCGVRLLHRTTHGLSLTDEGDTFLGYCRRLTDTAAELGSELSGKVSGPSGWVRMSMSPVIAEMVIAPSLPGLYQRHPKLHVDISADDRMADMARDGIDIAIRTGTLASDTLVARQLGTFGRTLVASPAYLQRHGTPNSVADLAHHKLIANSASATINRWPLTATAVRAGGGSGTGTSGRARAGRVSPGDAYVQVTGATRTDNSAVLLALVRHGVGMARVMDAVAAPLIRSGELVPLLQDQIDGQQVPIYAVMLQERHRLPKIRACIDYWGEWIAGMIAAAPPPATRDRATAP